MKIIAGIGLDSRCPNTTPSQLNSVIVGETGLIAELSMRAGLPESTQPKAERIVRYIDAMKQADDGHRFYSDSLKTDPVATAEKVLWYRDWAKDHGWDHQACQTGKLKDIASIEVFVQEISPTIGETISLIADRMDLVVSSIEVIELINEKDEWPRVYQLLFDTVLEAGIEIKFLPHDYCISANPDTDLGRFQHAILSGTYAPINFVGDGSLLTYQADSPTTAGKLLGQSLCKDHMVIASGEKYGLNTAAAFSGFAEPGLGESSFWRAPNQLLILLLQCAFSPPSSEVLMQYFTLPSGPYLPIRQRLSKLYSNNPGLNREAWDNEIDDYINTKMVHTPELDAEKLRADIQSWLPINLAQSRQSMQTGLAIELTEKVVDYWRAQLNASEEAENSVYISAFQSTEAFCQALRRWPDKDIHIDQLGRLFELLIDNGRTRFHHTRLVSELNVVETAEASCFYERNVSQLLWWDCQCPSEVSAPPFTDDELLNIPFAESESIVAKRKEKALKRQLLVTLAASQQLILIAINDKPDLLKLTFSQLINAEEWPKLESSIIEDDISDLSCSVVSDSTLPAASRWLSVDTSIDAFRQNQSFSSLRTLALKPHEYVFRYLAGLREGSLTALPFDARLKGILAHKVIENWFEQTPWCGKAPTVAELTSWLNKTFDVWVQNYALPLLDLGMRAERLAFKAMLQHAMQRLFEQLERAGIQRVLVEHRFERISSGESVEGVIDLFCESRDGSWSIIDMKWGSLTRYKEEISKGLHLQLATYAYLATKSPATKVTDVAYFILNKGLLLTASKHTYVGAIIVDQEAGTPNLLEVWRSFEKTSAWRRAQLAGGQVEVTYNDCQPTPSSAPPADCIPVLEIESKTSNTKNWQSNRKASFKHTDPWRVITGNIKE